MWCCRSHDSRNGNSHSDRPQTGNPDADTLSLERVDDRTAAFTPKRAGKVVITGTRRISADGKVMTITSKGTNAKGQPFNEVLVFDKRCSIDEFVEGG